MDKCWHQCATGAKQNITNTPLILLWTVHHTYIRMVQVLSNVIVQLLNNPLLLTTMHWVSPPCAYTRQADSAAGRSHTQDSTHSHDQPNLEGDEDQWDSLYAAKLVQEHLYMHVWYCCHTLSIGPWLPSEGLGRQNTTNIYSLYMHTAAHNTMCVHVSWAIINNSTFTVPAASVSDFQQSTVSSWPAQTTEDTKQWMR